MSAQLNENDQQYIQGTPEWLALRKTKITATDASIIMGASHWKTKAQLYHEKTCDIAPEPSNERMQRGLELEPLARDLFILQTGIHVEPKVIVKDWVMASLDGLSPCGKHLVEIKCPGEKDHTTALKGKVPPHYYPQLQHQLWVCDLSRMTYFSFDGVDGVGVEVLRDDEYIEKMIAEEHKFYECLINKIHPEPLENGYVERNDALWESYAMKWWFLSDKIKELEQEQQKVRDELIFLSAETNTQGAGISLCKVERKGNVDYSRIPELKNIDLEKYRKAPTTSWRITSK